MPILQDKSYQKWDERHIIISDYHYALFEKKWWNEWGNLCTKWETIHDPLAMEAVESFMKWWNPTHIWYNGDEIDTHQVSLFTKENHNLEGLENDIEGWKETIARHRSWFPKAEMVYLLGNHEFRWERWLIAHPQIRWMKGLSWTHMMEADKLGLPIYRWGERLRLAPDLMITHGELLGTVAGDAAKKYINKYKSSGISGHTHKLIIQPNTVENKTLYWGEAGCLSMLKPYYTVDPDWQQGIIVVYRNSISNIWKMQIAQIERGVLIFGDREF